MSKVILEKDFLAEDFDSLTFYDLLPTDDVKISHQEGKEPVSRLAANLMQTNIKDLKIKDLDDLAIGLINGCNSFNEFSDWHALADKMAIQYSELLLNEEARELRMKLSRINYFIRALLDKNIEVQAVDEWFIQAKGPWDFIRQNGKLFWIDCEESSLKVESTEGTSSYICGLPTQIDRLTGTEIGIGSHYSNGGWLLNGTGLKEISHTKPIVTFFVWKGATCYLDVDGLIFEKDKGVVDKIDLPFTMIHKCRFFEDRLVFFDWSQPKKGYIYHLDTKKGESLDLEAVIVCNDICFHSGFYYLIDKEQGHLFKYDPEFKLIAKESGLGRGKGKLYDPISIRPVDGELQVLNWFSGKVVSFKGFVGNGRMDESRVGSQLKEHAKLLAENYLDVVYSQEVKPTGKYPEILAKWMLDAHLKKTGRLLDIGSGRGEHLKAFSKLGYEVAGLDISPRAAEMCPEYDVRIANIEFEEMPYEKESFDFIFSKSVIEHTYQPAMMLDRMLSAMKPGGKAVVMTPSWIHTYKVFYTEYTHVRPFTKQSLYDAMRMAGYENVEVDYFYQLPLLWRQQWLMPFVKFLGMMPLPYRPIQSAPWPEGLNKIIRFTKDVMLIGVGTKKD